MIRHNLFKDVGKSMVNWKWYHVWNQKGILIERKWNFNLYALDAALDFHWRGSLLSYLPAGTKNKYFLKILLKIYYIYI